MMAPAQLEGVADSGFGILLHGFHAPVQEAPARLDALKSKLSGRAREIAFVEDNGYVTCLVVERRTPAIPSNSEFAMFRREPHRFFIDLPKFIASTRAQLVDRLILSGSLGSVSLVLLYRPAPPDADRA